MTENICSGTSLYIPDPGGDFANVTRTLAVIHGQMTGNPAHQVAYSLFPMLANWIFGADYFSKSSLYDMSLYTNPIILDLISDSSCDAFHDFSVITHDFIEDELVQAIIDRNFI